MDKKSRTPPVRFGIIGCGGIARWHITAIKMLEGAALAAVCDACPERAAAFGREFGVPFYSDMGEMLASGPVDAVSICTPSGLHADQCVSALRAGKHAVVEKPFAITEESVERVLRAERESAGTVCVISQLRYAAGALQAKQLVESGALGRITCADLSMKYWREEEYYAGSSWRGTWAMDGGGALMNQGIHGVDMLRFICGDYKSVSAFAGALRHSIETEDTLCAGIELQSGALGVISATTSCRPGQNRRLEICGDRGSLRLEENRLVWLETDRGHSFEDGGAALPSGASNPLNIAHDTHFKQIGDFVSCITKGRAYGFGAREAAGTVDLILAAYRSAETGRREPVASRRPAK